MDNALPVATTGHSSGHSERANINSTSQARMDLLNELLKTAAESAFGAHQIDEKRVAQLLGESVKSRLFTAEESYRLKDKILDSSHLDRAIDRRIEIALRQFAA